VNAGGEISDAALKALEFAHVTHAIARLATCEPGRRAVLSIRPRLGELVWADAEQALVEDAVGYFTAGGDFGFDGAVDVEPLVEHALKGASISGADLRSIADTEASLRRAVARVREAKRPDGPLRELAGRRARTDETIAAIERAIEADGRVGDAASSALASIRRQQRALHEQVRERCRSIIGSADLAKMLSEHIVTVRSGRYVVPVRSEFAAHFPGVAHDQSASGATVFMEPLASVEANNRLRSLEAEEEREMARVLAELSAQVAQQGSELMANGQLLAQLDCVGARARWAIAQDAGRPRLAAEPTIRIVRGRHPLLRREAVPLDFDIGESFDAVIVSGPNMGGKTVVLKTVGLFCQLTYAGIPLPAGAGTVIGSFGNVACVIGDEQSIAQDLSSFSAHLRALKAATTGANARSLVLVDEIGSGTEPNSGAALAQACIEALIRAGAKVVVTTHFTQLKTFAAAHDRVRNASMLFDPKTHAPTYVFAIGIPGQSLAFALARSLELDARVIARAETLLGIDAQNLERTFERLAEERDRLRQMQRQVEEQQARASRVEQSMRQRIAALEQEKEAFERRASAELAKAVDVLQQQLMEHAQRRSEAAARQASKPLPESERMLAQTLLEMRRSLGLEAPAPGSETAHWKTGDEVYVRSFDASGVVSEVYDDNLLVTMGNLKTLVPTRDVIARPRKRATGGPLERAHSEEGQRRSGVVEPSNSGALERSNLFDRKRREGSVKTPESGHLVPAAEAVTSVDVRGMRVDEAWPLIDKALDNATLAGLSELRVLHGKGTGRLSRGIREFLDGHPQVESMSSAPEREGGSGVTVVKLV
jgi:DNA mismatch repair protein MutS2